MHVSPVNCGGWSTSTRGRPSASGGTDAPNRSPERGQQGGNVETARIRDHLEITRIGASPPSTGSRCDVPSRDARARRSVARPRSRGDRSARCTTSRRSSDQDPVERVSRGAGRRGRPTAERGRRTEPPRSLAHRARSRRATTGCSGLRSGPRARGRESPARTRASLKDAPVARVKACMSDGCVVAFARSVEGGG